MRSIFLLQRPRSALRQLHCEHHFRKRWSTTANSAAPPAPPTNFVPGTPDILTTFGYPFCESREQGATNWNCAHSSAEPCHRAEPRRSSSSGEALRDSIAAGLADLRRIDTQIRYAQPEPFT